MEIFTQGSLNVPLNQDTDLRSVLATSKGRVFFVVTKNISFFLWMFFEFKDKFFFLGKTQPDSINIAISRMKNRGIFVKFKSSYLLIRPV